MWTIEPYPFKYPSVLSLSVFSQSFNSIFWGIIWQCFHQILCIKIMFIYFYQTNAQFITFHSSYSQFHQLKITNGKWKKRRLFHYLIKFVMPISPNFFIVIADYEFYEFIMYNFLNNFCSITQWWQYSKYNSTRTTDYKCIPSNWLTERRNKTYRFWARI